MKSNPYNHTLKVLRSVGLNILKQSLDEAPPSPYICQAMQKDKDLTKTAVRNYRTRVPDFTNLKCESHGHLYNIIHVVGCCPMCQIPKIKAKLKHTERCNKHVKI